ncbi:unnamed protein product, partial [marine sediment metagenome]
GIGIGEDEPELRTVTESQAVLECHRIIAATARERDDIVRHYGVSPQKIGVVPCGVNTEIFKPQDKQEARRQLGFNDGKILLFVGRIDPLKGIEQLLEAVARLKDKGVRLVVIGGDADSREVDWLQEMKEKLGLDKQITFQGLVKHDELPRFYHAADVTVMPSYYESFGLVGLESLACGTPVVATDVGDMRRIIRQGETGYVVANNNPEELAERISRLLAGEDSLKSPDFISRSVGHYDWSYIARAVSAELNRVVKATTAPVA